MQNDLTAAVVAQAREVCSTLDQSSDNVYEPATTADLQVGDVAYTWGFGAFRRGVVVKVGKTRVTIAHTTPSSVRTYASPRPLSEVRVIDANELPLPVDSLETIRAEVLEQTAADAAAKAEAVEQLFGTEAVEAVAPDVAAAVAYMESLEAPAPAAEVDERLTSIQVAEAKLAHVVDVRSTREAGRDVVCKCGAYFVADPNLVPAGFDARRAQRRHAAAEVAEVEAACRARVLAPYVPAAGPETADELLDRVEANLAAEAPQHSIRCRAAAIVCAVENVRDALLDGHEAGPGLQLDDVQAIADGYLADGTMPCQCVAGRHAAERLEAQLLDEAAGVEGHRLEAVRLTTGVVVVDCECGRHYHSDASPATAEAILKGAQHVSHVRRARAEARVAPIASLRVWLAHPATEPELVDAALRELDLRVVPAGA